jgi:hypothetical protein
LVSLETAWSSMFTFESPVGFNAYSETYYQGKKKFLSKSLLQVYF